MTAQRMTGGWLTIFTACVVLNHVLQGTVSAYDIAYGVFLVPLVASTIWESVLGKALQVAVILVAGAIMVATPDMATKAVGMLIMAFAQIHAYAYGFLPTGSRVRLALFWVAYLVWFSVNLDNIGTGFMWVLMCFTIHGDIWLNTRELVAKARRVDELEKIVMQNKLSVTKDLLHETVEAASVLSDEIKRQKNGNCEDE